MLRLLVYQRLSKRGHLLPLWGALQPPWLHCCSAGWYLLMLQLWLLSLLLLLLLLLLRLGSPLLPLDQAASWLCLGTRQLNLLFLNCLYCLVCWRWRIPAAIPGSCRRCRLLWFSSLLVQALAHDCFQHAGRLRARLRRRRLPWLALTGLIWRSCDGARGLHSSKQQPRSSVCGGRCGLLRLRRSAATLCWRRRARGWQPLLIHTQQQLIQHAASRPLVLLLPRWRVSCSHSACRGHQQPALLRERVWRRTPIQYRAAGPGLLYHKEPRSVRRAAGRCEQRLRCLRMLLL